MKNQHLGNITQTSVDKVTLFDRPHADNAKFIFNDSMNRLLRLCKQPNRGLTLDLFEPDSEPTICLDDITACLWRTQNKTNVVQFKNRSNVYFNVTFPDKGQLLYVQNQITHTFDASLIACTK